MTPQEIQIKVAEECGWINIAVYVDEQPKRAFLENYEVVQGNLNGSKELEELPPYTTSLDAIQKAALEKFTTYKERCLFDWHLGQKTSIDVSYWQLTALDWCEAFLATCEQLKGEGK